MLQNLIGLWESTGVYKMLYNAGVFQDDFYKTLIMYAIVAVLMYLAIGKKFEPLLLLPIAFGMLLANLPGTGMFHKTMFIPDANLLAEELKAAVTYTEAALQ